MTPSTIVVTGGAGFIGSNFVRSVLHRAPEVRIVNVDSLTYAANPASLDDVVADFGTGSDARYRFVQADIRDPEAIERVVGGIVRQVSPDGGSHAEPGSSIDAEWLPDEDWLPDAIVHFAAESHVDRSILGPEAFLETNVRGTLALLEACRRELQNRPRPFRFLHVSTDEVYGSLGLDDDLFTERTQIAPNSPYSASKAASDHFVRAYVETHGLPAIITRCSNNYGPYQFPEKLIPLMITRALRDEPLPLYGDGLNVRDWIHVLDHVDALWKVLDVGEVGDVYNIGGEAESTNLEIVRSVLGLLGKSEGLIHFVKDRAGHDRRYAMDTTRIREHVGWAPTRDLGTGLEESVHWYLENREWWESILSEAYRAAHSMYLS